MLVVAVETVPDGRVRWAGRRHDDDRPDATSGTTSAELFDAVFHALHHGEQVALGFDSPLTTLAGPDQDPTAIAADVDANPGLAELGHLLGELGMWRPWTTVSTSLARWKANTSILVWQAVPAPGTGPVPATAAADSFFRQFPAAARGTKAEATEPGGTQEANRTQEANGTVVNLAAATARRAGLFVDPSELTQPAATITVTDVSRS
jgi:hypothetical protein